MTDSELATNPQATGNMRWYVIHAYSGMEKSVKKGLEERIARSEMTDKFGRILVPSGYVLIEMEMTDESWHLVKNTPKVTGFVGGVRNRPSPISTAEVTKIMDQMQAGVDKPKPKTLFEVGEMVRVKEGPFTDFNGNVEEVNYEKSRLRVSVTIFGRGTPVELEFGQVEKM
jgi:transcriptional antiterminator NusG